MRKTQARPNDPPPRADGRAQGMTRLRLLRAGGSIGVTRVNERSHLPSDVAQGDSFWPTDSHDHAH